MLAIVFLICYTGFITELQRKSKGKGTKNNEFTTITLFL